MAFKREPAAEIYNPPEYRVVYELDLQLGKRMNPEILHLMQYDAGIPIAKVNLYVNNQPYKVPNEAAVNIRMNKPDGKGVYNSALGISSDRTSAYIAVTGQMTAAYGMGVASIEIVSGAGLIGTAIMAIDVEKNPVQDEQYESTDEFKTLLELVDEAKKAADEAKKAAEEATHPDPAQKGYYETAEGLREAYPSGEDGNWAIVGETDTIWVWDSDRAQWTDSGNNTDLSDYYTRGETDGLLSKKLSTGGGSLYGGLWVQEGLSVQGELQVPNQKATIKELVVADGVTSHGKEIGAIYASEEVYVGYTCCAGYVTASRTKIRFTLQFVRPIAATGAEFTTLFAAIRGVNGYIDGLQETENYSTTELISAGYRVYVQTLSFREQDQGCITAIISKEDNAEFENATNNTPVSVFVDNAFITFKDNEIA